MIDNGFREKANLVSPPTNDGTAVVGLLLPIGGALAFAGAPVLGGLMAAGGALYIGSAVRGLVREIRQNRKARKVDGSSSGPLH